MVIHSQLQRPDHLDKYVRLGMSPSYFTNHTYFWGDVHVTNFGRERADFISPIKAAKAKGMPMTVMNIKMAAKNQPSAIQRPPQISQITFKMSANGPMRRGS